MQASSEYSNPFISKTPVRGKSFFGRDDLLRKIFDYINAGESVSLVGERRTGKTSILLRVLDWKEQLLSQPIQHVLVLMDFLGLDYRSDTDIWITLMTALLNEMAQAGLETGCVTRAVGQLQSGELVFQTLLKMFRTLAKHRVSITFLFDEFEATVYGRNPVDLRFYKILRNLALDKETRASYVIATRQELSKVEMSLEKQFTDLSSPLFNIFHQAIITSFSEIEARQMVNSLLQSAGLDLAAKLSFWLQRDLLFQLSGFHPFFLQIACYQLFEHCVLPDGTFSDQVPEDNIISAFLGEAGSHFGYYWDISSLEERRLMGELATDHVIVDIQSRRPVLNSLRNRCLVIKDVDAKSGWQLFSSVFAQWIEEQQVGAWYEEGAAQLAGGEFDRALVSLRRVYTRRPDYRDVADRLAEAEKKLKVVRLFGLASGHEAASEWKEAIRAYREILDIDRYNQEAARRLNRAQRRAERGARRGLSDVAIRVREWWDEQERRTKTVWMVLLGIIIFGLCSGVTASLVSGIFPLLTPTPTTSPTASPTSTFVPTETPSPTPVPTDTPTPTSTPTLTPTPAPTPTTAPSATPSPTPTSEPTAIPVLPEPMVPENGSTHKSPITFQWGGFLRAGQAYQVVVHHPKSGYLVRSGSLTNQSWILDLPAERYGEWRWTVSVIQGGQVLVTSSEWMFWFNPSGGEAGGGSEAQPTKKPPPP
jgi:cell division septation protein DedD